MYFGMGGSCNPDCGVPRKFGAFANGSMGSLYFIVETTVVPYLSHE